MAATGTSARRTPAGAGGPGQGAAAAVKGPVCAHNYINIFHYRNNRVSRRSSPVAVIPGNPQTLLSVPNPPLSAPSPSLIHLPPPPPHPPGNWSPDHFIIRTFFPRLIECEAAAAAALRSPYELLPFLVREASLSRPVTRPAKISISI